MEEYEKEHPPSEQVMVASQHGFISRIMVDTVPVIDKRTVAKGIRVVKIKSNKDCLSSISLLSAADNGVEDEPEGEGGAAAVKDKTVKEEETAEPEEEEPSSAAVPEEPRKATPKKMRSSSLRALPVTPTQAEAKNSQGLAAAAVLGTPMESPGRRISGKRSMADITASPSVNDRGVARPSLEGSRDAPAQSRGTSGGRGTSAGRGRGRPAAVPKAGANVKVAKLVPESPMRRALGKRSLSSLSNMTEPTFD